MGIRLDWEVESDEGRGVIGEDAAAIAKEKRQQRLRVRVLIGVVVVLAAIIGAALWRYKIVWDEKERTLINTVEAEALALRLGDQDKFMKFQGPAADWRDAQKAHFQEVQIFRATATGRILDLTMTSDEARVRVEMLVNDASMDVVWLYEYSATRGWRHVGTEQSPWVQETRRSGPITFKYYSPDAPLVNDLELTLTHWWRLAMTETGMIEPLRIEVVLDRDAGEVEWEDDERTRLLVPPHDLARLEESGILEQMMAERWTRYATRLDNPRNSFERLMVEQITLSLGGSFGVSIDEPTIFTTLDGMLGAQSMAGFIKQLGLQEEPDAIDAMRALFESSAPENPDSAYFEGMLEFGFSHMSQLLNSPPRGFELFVDQTPEEDADSTTMPILMQYTPFPIERRSIEVVRIQPFQDVLWVEATYMISEGSMSNMLYSDEPIMIIIPFRKTGGYWKMTQVREGDWGADVTEAGEHITLTYPELDAEYYGDMLPLMEAIYLGAADDYGLENPPPLDIVVRKDNIYSRDNPASIQPDLHSPHLSLCCSPIRDMKAYTTDVALSTIYYEVRTHQLGPIPTGFTRYSFDTALIVWSWKQYQLQGVWPNELEAWLNESEVVVGEVVPPDSLEALWNGDMQGDDEAAMYRLRLQRLGADVLIEILMDRYGKEAYLPLVTTLRTATTLEEWLSESVGATTGEIEAEWLAQYHIAIRERYGDVSLP